MSILNGSAGRIFLNSDFEPPTDIISSEAQAVLNRMSNTSTAEDNAIIAFVDSQVSSGNWNLIDEFWCFALNSTDALTSWKTKTATNSGAVYTANQGYAFNGSTDYIDTNFVPSVDGVNYTQNDAFFGGFLYAWATSGTNSRFWGARNGTIFSWINQNSTTRTRNPINEGAEGNMDISRSSPPAKTTYLNTRTGASTTAIYENGSTAATGTGASTGVNNVSFYIGAYNNNGTAADHGLITVSSWYVGGAVGFNQSDFDTNLDTLLTTLGVSTT